MPSYAIFVGFPADDWSGPTLVRWEPGLVEKDYLALRAGGDDGPGAAPETHWVGCRLGDLEQIRFCEVTARDSMLPCFQAEIQVRGTGTVYVYLSRPCLGYLRDSGVPLAEMQGEDVEACRTLWSELSGTDDDLSTEVCSLVNSRLS